MNAMSACWSLFVGREETVIVVPSTVYVGRQVSEFVFLSWSCEFTLTSLVSLLLYLCIFRFCLFAICRMIQSCVWHHVLVMSSLIWSHCADRAIRPQRCEALVSPVPCLFALRELRVNLQVKYLLDWNPNVLYLSSSQRGSVLHVWGRIDFHTKR